MDKKKILTTVAVGAATLAAGAASVHADSVKVTEEQVGDETKITTTTTKTEATQQQINKTKSEISSQQSVVNQDKAKMNSAQLKVNQDSANTANAQNVVNQKKADLTSAQKAVVDAKKNQPTVSEIQNNQNAQKAAQSKVDADKSSVSSQQTVVDQARSSQANAQSAYNQAQSKLSDAQAKNTSTQKKVADDQSTVNADQQKVSADQSKINSQQTTVNNDQQRVTEDQTKISQGNTKLQNDNKKLNDDQNTLNNDQQTLTNDQNAVNATQKKLDDVKSQVGNNDNVVNTINVPAGYTTALINQGKDPNQSAAVQQQTIKGMVASYKHDSAAEKQVVNPDDLGNLPSNYQTELNNFVLGIVNSVRKQMGLSPLTVTEGSIKLADDVAKGYGNDDWNITVNKCTYQGKQTFHDISALQNAAKQNGMTLFPDENDSSSIFGEDNSDIQSKRSIKTDLSSWSNQYKTWMYSEKFLSNNSPLTMDDLEENAYYSVMSMLFFDADSQFGHAAHLTEDNGYMGVAYDSLGQLHFEFYNSNNSGNLDNTPIVTSSNDSSALQKQANDLQNQLTQQQNKVKADQAKVNADKQVVANDQNQIKQDTPAGLENQLQNDQQILQNDRNTLANDQKALQNDQQSLTNAQNALTQDQANANQAQSDLTAAQQNANTAKENLNNANTALTNAQNKLNDLNNQLSNDEAKLAHLQNTSGDQAALKDAESKLAQAETDYINAVKALNDAQEQENKDRDALAQAQKDYNNALQELNKLETELENEEKTITTTSVQWIKNQHPSTTADMGNTVPLHPSTKPSSTTNTNKDNGSKTPAANKNQSTQPADNQAPAAKPATSVKNDSTSTVTTTVKPAAPIKKTQAVKNQTVKVSDNVENKKSEPAYVSTDITPAKNAVAKENNANVVYADNVETVKNSEKTVNNNDVITFTTEAPVVKEAVEPAAKKNTMPQTGENANAKTTLWGEISLAAAGILSALGLADRKRRN